MARAKRLDTHVDQIRSSDETEYCVPGFARAQDGCQAQAGSDDPEQQAGENADRGSDSSPSAPANEIADDDQGVRTRQDH
jgi:hypothetical protein